MLKKVECFINPSSLDDLKEGLFKAGVEGMSVIEARLARAFFLCGMRYNALSFKEMDQ